MQARAVSVIWSEDDLGVSPDPDRYDEAVRAFRRRVPVTDAEWKAMEREERQRAFHVANVAQADLVQEVFDALASAIETGAPFDDFKAEIGAQLAEAWSGEQPYRLETVFRTNVMAAYTGGAEEILQRPAVKEARPYCRQDVIDDDRLCEICAPMGGVVLPADDPYWATHVSPFHHSCRCPPRTPLTEEEALAEGITPEPPEAEAADGFGAAPRVDDWEPDPSLYEDGLGDALARKLG